MADRHTTKYLQTYAEPLVQSLTQQVNDLEVNQHSSDSINTLGTIKTLSQFRFDHVVVIPAYKESTEFVQRFINSSLSQVNVLVVLVINQPDYDSDLSPQKKLNDFVLGTGKLVFTSEKISLVSVNNTKLHYCIIDAFTESIPEKQGVGLARKLGTDFAVMLKNNNQITSEWIHSTDADAQLPDNYFSALASNQSANTKGCIALSYNFSHQSNNVEIHNANQLYETALRYYVAGMKYAHSHYTFFTIGSLIAFKTSEYSKVRGFPKRSAGEDFYLINKLAKLGEIGFIEEAVVLIEARESNRVPFGTGPTVSKIMELNRNGLPYCYYNPLLFIELKTCLKHLGMLWQQRFEFTQWISELSKPTQQALLENQFESFVNNQKNNNEVQFNKQLLVWFDAFKTLKFLHSLRDNGLQDIPLNKALIAAPFSL